MQVSAPPTAPVLPLATCGARPVVGPRVDVRTNSRDGLHIVFQASSEPVRAVQLRGNGGDAILLPGAPRGISSHRIELDYRLLLSPSARPGVYPWPVQLVATPL